MNKKKKMEKKIIWNIIYPPSSSVDISRCFKPWKLSYKIKIRYVNSMNKILLCVKCAIGNGVVGVIILFIQSLSGDAVHT